MKVQDTKKKKRAPKASSLEDWESEGQSASLGEFFSFLCIYTTANVALFCTAFRLPCFALLFAHTMHVRRLPVGFDPQGVL
jgi:hypothetical protein